MSNHRVEGDAPYSALPSREQQHKRKTYKPEITAMKTIISSHHSLLTIFSSQSRLSLIALTLAAFAFVQSGEAVNPPPDGGYAGANTAEGQNALLNLTTGTANTAVGFLSLSSMKKANFNTALGAGTLLVNGADENTATGAGALLSNTNGNVNTANGAFALFLNTDGAFNTATGDRALFSNTDGSNNTANGATALSNNTVGTDNTADGVSALANNVTGNLNTAIGVNALFNNTTGSNNIALGFLAGDNVTGENNIDIGAEGVADDSNTIRIGTNQRGTFIAGIRGATTANANAIPVLIDSAGQLGTLSSSRRFKKEIEPMDKASEAILALKPVTFHYKHDKTGTPQFGLIAEEVARVNPELVVRDNNGEIYTVRYDAVNAMLLNEFLKEHKKVEQQQANIAALTSTVAQQQKGMEVLTAQLKEQEAQIQRVSGRIEAGKSAPQMVLNNR
jgi:endosialidase-like protein